MPAARITANASSSAPRGPSAQADLVIANHALVMVNAARGRDHAQRPTRIVFDEGHHVFDAADSHLRRRADRAGGDRAAGAGSSAPNAARRAAGAGSPRGSPMSPAMTRQGGKAIAAACEAAEALPGDGWLQRLAEGVPSGPIETLLAAVRATDLCPRRERRTGSGLRHRDRGGAARRQFRRAGAAGGRSRWRAIRQPLIRLGVRLEALLEDAPDWLDAQGRARIEGARHSLAWRIDTLAAWEALLDRLGGPADPDFVDWLAVDRSDAREFDVGIHRRLLDPMKPFARVVLEAGARRHADQRDPARRARTGEAGPPSPASGADISTSAPRSRAAASPFDYAGKAEVLIVTDVQAAAISPRWPGAYAADHRGSGRRRARPVHRDPPAARGPWPHRRPARARRAAALRAACRSDRHRHAGRYLPRRSRAPRCSAPMPCATGSTCPGKSLRCVVMEQVPWPQPDHPPPRAPRGAAAARAYDDRDHPRAAGAGVRPADPQQGRPRPLRRPVARLSLRACSPPSRTGTPVVRVTLDEALQRVGGGVSERPIDARPA